MMVPRRRTGRHTIAATAVLALVAVVAPPRNAVAFVASSQPRRPATCSRLPPPVSSSSSSAPVVLAAAAPEASDEEPPETTLDWGELEWRVQRSRLTYYNTLAVLRRKPRYLPYEEAKKWVQRMGLWETESEWNEWLASGEKRNPYIPNRPDKYYGDAFKGWTDFLCGSSSCEPEPSYEGVIEAAIRDATTQAPSSSSSSSGSSSSSSSALGPPPPPPPTSPPDSSKRPPPTR